MTTAESVSLKRGNAPRYDLGCYDTYLCLKPPLLLGLMLVLLCRDYLLPLIAAAASFKGGGINMKELVFASRGPYWFVAGLPALLVLYAWIRRSPSGDAVARQAWRFGQPLLTLSILIGAWGPLHKVAHSIGLLNDAEMMALLVLIMQSTALAYLWLSPRVRDAFRQFPERKKN